MKKRCAKRVVAKILTAIVVLSTIIMNGKMVLANSMPRNWSGVCQEGVISIDEDCPIEVVKETLVFDINEFPENVYSNEEEFLAYTGSVTAKYVFHNPADYTVEATLAFPFGEVPEYGMSTRDIYDNSAYEANLDTLKYGVMIDGKPVESQLHYTFYEGLFDSDDDSLKLVDGYIEDGFYTQDMAVTKYVYRLRGEVARDNGGAYVSFKVSIGDKTRLMIDDYMDTAFENGQSEFGMILDYYDTCTIYVIGEQLDEGDVEIAAYTSMDKKNKIDAEVNVAEIETMTFKELAMKYYDNEDIISESDWYNAVVTYMKAVTDIYNLRLKEGDLDIREHFLGWYTYEISMEPGQTIVNEVTAPMYPTINTQSMTEIYEYTYLLSPASKWSDFGELEVIVNTPYYMLSSSIGEFQKTDAGYMYKHEGLPEGELFFKMSTTKNPGIVYWFENNYKEVLGLGLVYLVSAGVVLIIILLVIRVHRKMCATNKK